MTRLNAETAELVISILEDTWASLRIEEKARTSKTLIAHRLLKAVAVGETDPARLRIKALTGVVISGL
jgi:hypothetical protein